MPFVENRLFTMASIATTRGGVVHGPLLGGLVRNVEHCMFFTTTNNAPDVPAEGSRTPIASSSIETRSVACLTKLFISLTIACYAILGLKNIKPGTTVGIQVANHRAHMEPRA